MANRMWFGAILLLVGGVFIAATVFAASWIDTTNVHENTALNQSAVQAALQGKTITEWTQHFTIVSPLFLWAVFGIGGFLIVVGLLIGLRSFRPHQLSS
ncbi:MAG TPA: hypothetical protein VKU02_03855 [Gemmataceae bacterium]|nr:hypothetical protein [Gemmataceae bacterium]